MVVSADINGGSVSGYYGEGILIRPEIMGLLTRNYTPETNASWTVFKKREGI
jgi:hypothetical protein